MNKTAIKNFAIWARVQLIEAAKQRAFEYEITENGENKTNVEAIGGRLLSKDEKQQRSHLIAQINQKGYAQVMEEAAYTWFNRFIALRFMEVNGYLPSKIRVFTDEKGAFKPEILKQAMSIELDGLDRNKVLALLDAQANEDLYKYLLITQCNALNAALPEMFEKLGSYTEMLLPNNILKPDSVLGRLVTDIPEEDWKDAVQIIGWMYQYYNTEPKQAVFDGLKKNVKITKEKIPAATQLFTPDWIVRYMVENSLGRLWLESHPNDALKADWKYYLNEAEQTPEVTEKLRVMRSQSPVKSPEDIRLIDPCMGSGHILVYAFDVLMQIYESEGYNPRDAAKLILEKNIYGLDIDCRAYQLAYFSLMMKARLYNRRIFTEDVRPQVYHPAGFPDGEEYGSLMKVDTLPPKPEEPKELTLFTEKYETTLNTWNFKCLLAQKYDVVVTNPPYMGSSGMGAKMSDFVKNTYPDSKSDLFAVFIEKCGEMLKPTGYQAMITQHAWMFLPSYEKLRGKLLQRYIVNMAHLGARAFDEISGEVVQTTAFVLSSHKTQSYIGTYARLVEFGSQSEKEFAFLNHEQRHYCTADNFAKIPGSPLVYWAGYSSLKCFDTFRSLENYGDSRQGMATGNNEKYVRFWYEPNIEDISFNSHNHSEFVSTSKKYITYIKSSGLCRWYGNNFTIIRFDKAYYDLLSKSGNCLPSRQYYYRKNANWSLISTGRFGARFSECGSSFDVGAHAFFGDDKLIYDVLGYLNSVVFSHFIIMLTPTLNYNSGMVQLAPYATINNDEVKGIVENNIALSRADWDSYEISWDFKQHPLICGERRIAGAFDKWEREAKERFDTLKANEEELNRIFIDIYGLQDELTPEVEDKDVTVRRADLGREIRSLLSYAVGCMFGRYSLDTEGLAYAGGDWNSGKYRSFIPDKDNILPICDDEYFDDDILGRFVDFVRVVYGAETLEENLKYIADALGGNGTPREVIRNYFLNDFFKDHCKIYQKRPIYWLFDSGKKNGFKALIYMHRYQPDLLARMRTDYVHEQQERYRTQLQMLEDSAQTAAPAERVKLNKQITKLKDQSLEIQKYEEQIHHLADQMIPIDLDDGVKVNYAKFADVLAVIK